MGKDRGQQVNPDDPEHLRRMNEILRDEQPSQEDYLEYFQSDLALEELDE